jgi:cytochrome c peroxidase
MNSDFSASCFDFGFEQTPIGSRGLSSRTLSPAGFGMDRCGPFALIVIVFLSLAASSQTAWAQTLPPVPVPPENPITPEKAVLGKIIFWDEQLSSDNTVACGTCHLPENSGADPRVAIHPGLDGIFGSADDVFGAQGVVRRDSSGAAIVDPVFGTSPQVTPRAAPSFFQNLFALDTLWDGRADTVFVDPLSPSMVLIASGGALESQAVLPILNSVEMAKDGRTWAEVTAKLAAIVPLAIATDLPADILAALATTPLYPDLFNAAFGTPDITPSRIAFAIATYERTLVADQTPFDDFVAGDPSALTPAQQTGLNFFQISPCSICHPSPMFTGNRFKNIGLRDPAEDSGLEGVTGNAGDLAEFKVPSLRGTGLKTTLMHTGQITSVTDGVLFYDPSQFHFPTNLDPAVPIAVPAPILPDLVDFIENGLTDPRLVAGLPPFDRPTLASELGAPVPVPMLGPLWLLGLTGGMAAFGWNATRAHALADSQADTHRRS